VASRAFWYVTPLYRLPTVSTLNGAGEIPLSDWWRAVGRYTGVTYQKAREAQLSKEVRVLVLLDPTSTRNAEILDVRVDVRA